VLSQRPDPECWLLQLQRHQQKGNPAEKCKMQFITYLLKKCKMQNAVFIYLFINHDDHDDVTISTSLGVLLVLHRSQGCCFL